MPSATRDYNLPLVSGENAASPAANVPTQAGTNDTTPAPAVPVMPLPPTPAQLAPYRDADEDESIAPRVITLAAATAVEDPVTAAPEGACESPNVDGKVDGVNGAANGIANSTRGSTDPLFVRRRAGTGVSDAVLSISDRALLGQLIVPMVIKHSRHLLFPISHTSWYISSTDTCIELKPYGRKQRRRCSYGGDPT
jgi:hypothetical protein